mmetsp:Transcript_10310/g.15742  ORF Transcript_10310/g.15742 Transcript_10310/m.15742 type:complete len:195 (+) Transcript_10310:20-604(+)
MRRSETRSQAFRVVTALNPVEIFRTTKIALKDGFNTAREMARDNLSILSRSSSWLSDALSDDEDNISSKRQSFDSFGRDENEPEDSTTRKQDSLIGWFISKKQTSTISHGTSNISDTSTLEVGQRKSLLQRIRSSSGISRSTSVLNSSNRSSKIMEARSASAMELGEDPDVNKTKNGKRSRRIGAFLSGIIGRR